MNTAKGALTSLNKGPASEKIWPSTKEQTDHSVFLPSHDLWQNKTV